MDWAGKEDFLAQIRPGFTPPALRNKPELHEWMSLYVEGFYTLHETRSCGFDVNPISMSDIMAYCVMFNVYEPDVFAQYIIAMDRVFLAKRREKDKSDGSTN